MWGKLFQFLSKSFDAYVDFCIGVPTQQLEYTSQPPAPISSISVHRFDFSLPQPPSTTWYDTFRIEDYLSKRLKNTESIAFWGSCSIFKTGACQKFYNTEQLMDAHFWTHIVPYHDKQLLVFLDNSNPPGSAGSHWQVYVFNKADYKLYKFDALNWSARLGVVAEIKNHIKKLWPEDIREIEYSPVDIPKQPNHWDCGPAVCWVINQIASQGLQSVLEWAQSHSETQYDYGAFRANVDVLIGPEPLTSSSTMPLIFSSAGGAAEDPISLDSDDEEDHFKDLGEKRNPICIDLGDFDEPDIKRKRISRLS